MDTESSLNSKALTECIWYVFQALQNELLRKSRDQEALNQAGEALIDSSEKDQMSSRRN